MKFYVHPVPSLALATLALLTVDSAQAQSQPVGRRSGVVQFVGLSQAEAKDSVRGLYVAIMGEVSHPGTYHLDPSELTLNAIVRRGGGLTDEASKSVRVIRGGRLIEQVTYSEDHDRSTHRLAPGDLLIFDSRQSAESYGRVTEFTQDPTTIRAGYEVASPPPGVQVALLNVLDYPLVVNLPLEEATTGNLLERLGQPSTLLANARVIAPGRRGHNAEGSAGSITLTSGTAVVFDKGAVRREHLPSNLPKPIESDIAAGAQSGLIGHPRGQSAELRKVGQQMLPSSTGANSLREDVISAPRATEPSPSQLPRMGQSAEEPKFELPVPTLTSNPRVATVPVPFTGSPRISKSSVGKSEPESHLNEEIPQPETPTVDNSVAIPTTEPLPTLDDEVAAPAANSSIPLAVMTLAIAGAVIAGAHLYRKRLERQAKSLAMIPSLPTIEPIIQAVPRPEPMLAPAAVVKTMLERMINNDLPLTVEAIEFPAEIVLQGRIAAKPILRVDPAQDVVAQTGPHFVTTEQMIPESSLHDVIAQMDTPESMPRRPHFMTTEKSSATTATGSPREPRPATSHQVGPRSNAPLANALFDLERGDRS